MPRGLSAKLKKKIANENKSILSFIIHSGSPKQVATSSDISKHAKSPNSIHLGTSDGKIEPQTKTHNDIFRLKYQDSYPRTCPRFKWIPDTTFTVDAFKYGCISGCTAYFLTHFHYDHYGGLSRAFTGNIYCSEITKNFILQNFGCNLKVHALPMNTFVNIQGCDVMLLDANHCPGSVMILFRLVLQNKVVLHTGDFRAQSWMLEQPSVLKHYIQSPVPSSCARITTLFLDTTYCCPTYGFPTQDAVIAAAVNVTREFLLSDPDTLVVCGMYSIGKERFVLGLVKALGLTIWLPSKQRRLIEAAAGGGCVICSDLLQRQAPSRTVANLVVVDMGKLNARSLRTEFCPSTGSADRRTLLAWRPTGWTHNGGTKKQTSSAALSRLTCLDLIQSLADCLSVIHASVGLTILGAAYSEHSSFEELKNFVTALRPLKVQQTVFGSSVKEAKKHINSWLSGTPQVSIVSSSAPSIASFTSSSSHDNAEPPSVSETLLSLPSTWSVTPEFDSLAGIFEEDSKDST